MRIGVKNGEVGGREGVRDKGRQKGGRRFDGGSERKR